MGKPVCIYFGVMPRRYVPEYRQSIRIDMRFICCWYQIPGIQQWPGHIMCAYLWHPGPAPLYMHHPPPHIFVRNSPFTNWAIQRVYIEPHILQKLYFPLKRMHLNKRTPPLFCREGHILYIPHLGHRESTSLRCVL